MPVTAIYGSDFSVVGYKDQDMNVDLAWDASLLAGYRHEFLSHVAAGGAKNDQEVSTAGLGAALRRIQPRAILLSGYWPRFCSEAFLAAWCTGVPLLFRGDHGLGQAAIRREGNGAGRPFAGVLSTLRGTPLRG